MHHHLSTPVYYTDFPSLSLYSVQCALCCQAGPAPGCEQVLCARHTSALATSHTATGCGCVRWWYCCLGYSCCSLETTPPPPPLNSTWLPLPLPPPRQDGRKHLFYPHSHFSYHTPKKYDICRTDNKKSYPSLVMVLLRTEARLCRGVGERRTIRAQHKQLPPTPRIRS